MLCEPRGQIASVDGMATVIPGSTAAGGGGGNAAAGAASDAVADAVPVAASGETTWRGEASGQTARGRGSEPARAGEPARVGIVMGSDSDLKVMRLASETLAELRVTHELRVLSAHRTPDDMLAYGHQARERGLQVIIAGAGGAAHLPGMLAAVTVLPVIGVPVPLRELNGLDSLLSIVQMPAGVPVATVAIGAARNAALLAARILAVGDSALREALEAMAFEMAAASRTKDERLIASTSGERCSEPVVE